MREKEIINFTIDVIKDRAILPVIGISPTKKELYLVYGETMGDELFMVHLIKPPRCFDLELKAPNLPLKCLKRVIFDCYIEGCKHQIYTDYEPGAESQNFQLYADGEHEHSASSRSPFVDLKLLTSTMNPVGRDILCKRLKLHNTISVLGREESQIEIPVIFKTETKETTSV